MVSENHPVAAPMAPATVSGEPAKAVDVASAAASSTIAQRAIQATSERLNKGQQDFEVTKPLTPSQQQALESLKALQLNHVGIERQYREEWTQLKLKYFRQLRPLYDERLTALKKDAPGGEAASVAGPLALPDFWLTAMKNHSTVLQTIEPHDEPILRYLENIDYKWLDENEQLSFKITMTFAENPFFSNHNLTKEFHLEDTVETNESVLSKSIGTEIQWHPGKNVLKKTCTRKQRNKRTGETRYVKNTVDRESFFHFFDSHEIPDDEKLETMHEQEVQALENTLEVEYELGCIFRDKIITHAVGWYLGTEIDEDEEDESDSDVDAYDSGMDDEDSENDSEEEAGESDTEDVAAH